MDDPANFEVVRQMQEDLNNERGEGMSEEERQKLLNRASWLSKKEVIASQKVLQELSIDQIQKLKSMNPNEI